MSKSTPSLLALLGLVAFAGYQNRSRIGDMLTDARQSAQDDSSTPDRSSFLADIGQTLEAGLSGSGLSSALGDLMERFKATGQGPAAESWVATGANQPVNVDELKTALGPETLADLAMKTGLSQQELLLRLNAALPDVVNRLTPNGHLPANSDTQTFI